jgi:hypothetical protein
VAAERRSSEDIRRELAAERDQLADALADLRGGMQARRRSAALGGGALAVALGAAAALRVVRRLRRA